jgi:hypothetical protein
MIHHVDRLLPGPGLSDHCQAKVGLGQGCSILPATQASAIMSVISVYARLTPLLPTLNMVALSDAAFKVFLRKGYPIGSLGTGRLICFAVFGKSTTPSMQPYCKLQSASSILISVCGRRREESDGISYWNLSPLQCCSVYISKPYVAAHHGSCYLSIHKFSRNITNLNTMSSSHIRWTQLLVACLSASVVNATCNADK